MTKVEPVELYMSEGLTRCNTINIPQVEDVASTEEVMGRDVRGRRRGRRSLMSCVVVRYGSSVVEGGRRVRPPKHRPMEVTLWRGTSRKHTAGSLVEDRP